MSSPYDISVFAQFIPFFYKEFHELPVKVFEKGLELIKAAGFSTAEKVDSYFSKFASFDDPETVPGYKLRLEGSMLACEEETTGIISLHCYYEGCGDHPVSMKMHCAFHSPSSQTTAIATSKAGSSGIDTSFNSEKEAASNSFDFEFSDAEID